MKKKSLFTLLTTLMVSAFCAMPVYAKAPANGSYSFKQGEQSVNVYVDQISSAKNYTVINMYKHTDDNTQDFLLEQQADGSYKISIAKTGYTMNVEALKANTDVIVYKDKPANTEYYLIQETDQEGFYTIRLQNKDSLALTATGGKGLTFKKYTGDANQKFYFEANVETDTPASSNTGADTKVTEISPAETRLEVPRISTQNKKWANFEYDKNAKIKDYGCLLCSITAVLSEVDGTTYRPDEIAEKFRFSDGYLQWGSGWGKRFKTGVDYSLETVVSELEEGNPVLVHGYSSKYGNHWAVITGFSGDGTKTSQFTVMDPSFSSTKTLQQFFKMFSGKKRLVLVK